jgi:hypothetical protein
MASAWLIRPVSHNRDVRSELLVKLALLDRSGADPQPLLDAQRDQLLPVASALQDRLAAAAGFDRTLVLWRCETVSANPPVPRRAARPGYGRRAGRVAPEQVCLSHPATRRPLVPGRLLLSH